tara:strand:+ start:452 stop:1798 length:1347 start_codon:yes stop_codon:yes gene_type:complete
MKKPEDMRPAPSNRDAEDAVLGACLAGGRNTIEKAMAWIKDNEAFYFDETKKVWKILQSMYKNNQVIDIVNVSNQHKEIYDESNSYYISGLYTDTATTANIETYSKIVWEKYIQREIGRASYLLYKNSFKKYNQTMDLLINHRKLTEELISLAPEMKKDTNGIVDETISAMLTGSNIIPYNFWALDRPAGGMTRKELTVLGGRPGHGKTTLMVNVIRHLADNPNLKVAVFNREMSNTEMMKKIFVMESDELTYNLLRQEGTKDIIESNVKSLEKMIKEKYKNVFMYENIRDLDETMREIGKIQPDVVIDDYIQLIRTADGGKDRRFQLEEIMQEYKWAAKKWNFAGLLLSQLNREIEKRIDPVPRMSDYSESGVIEQTAETAMFVFYGYNFDPSGYDKYESQIITAKARYGQIGNFVVGFCGDKCKFYGTPTSAMEDEAKCQENRDKL